MYSGDVRTTYNHRIYLFTFRPVFGRESYEPDRGRDVKNLGDVFLTNRWGSRGECSSPRKQLSWCFEQTI